MRRLILTGSAGLLLIVLLTSMVRVVNADTYDPVEATRQQIAIQHAHALAPIDLAVATLWRFIPLVAALIALTLAARWGWVAIARFRDERRPNVSGLLPVSAGQLDAVAPLAIALYHQARIEESRRSLVPTVPTTITASYSPQHAPHLDYSPHHAPRLDYRGDSGRGTVPAADDPAAFSGQIPTFSELLTQGRIGRGLDGRALPLLLGFTDTGAELVGSWLDLYSTAVAGFPGSGKTTTQRFLACQTALLGARFVIIDPQANAGEESLAGTLAPLSACFLAQPASAESDILDAVRLVAEIGERRVQGRDPDTTPVILWADELTKLLGRSSIGPKLAELLEAVAQEYRKKRVFVCGSGQIWTAERTTSELRDSFASVIAHRMKRGQARMLLPSDEAGQVERLATGRAILWRTSGETSTIAIPLTTASDVQQVAGLLNEGTQATHQATSGVLVTPPVEATRQPNGSQVAANHKQATSALGGGGAPTAEAQRAAALFLDGKDLSAVVFEMRGIKSSEGRRYQTALAEVQAMIRLALQ